ncbi:hypothetical protein BGZ94_005315, partial [Podila epigama]
MLFGCKTLLSSYCARAKRLTATAFVSLTGTDTTAPSPSTPTFESDAVQHMQHEAGQETWVSHENLENNASMAKSIFENFDGMGPQSSKADLSRP